MGTSKAHQELNESASATELANDNVALPDNSKALTVINTVDLFVEQRTIHEVLSELPGPLPGAVLVEPVDPLEAQTAMEKAIKKIYKSERRMRLIHRFALLPFLSTSLLPLLTVTAFYFPLLLGDATWAQIVQSLSLVGISTVASLAIVNQICNSIARPKLKKFIAELTKSGYRSYDEYVSQSIRNEHTDPSISHEALYGVLELEKEKRKIEKKHLILSKKLVKLRGDSPSNRESKRKLLDKMDRRSHELNALKGRIAALRTQK